MIATSLFAPIPICIFSPLSNMILRRFDTVSKYTVGVLYIDISPPPPAQRFNSSIDAANDGDEEADGDDEEDDDDAYFSVSCY